MTTPKLHRSQRLSYVLASPTNASTTSGAMNSALPTGVSSCGVARGELSELLNLIPEPRSKSQIFTGVSWSWWTHRMFSGFRSRWAIPDKTEPTVFIAKDPFDVFLYLTQNALIIFVNNTLLSSKSAVKTV